MKAQNLAILVAVMLVVGFAIIGLLVRRDRERRTARQMAISSPVVETASAAPPPPPKELDASRETRDELRRKILEAWAAGEKGPEVAEEAKQGRFEEHPADTPTSPKDWGIEPAYIQAAMREQMFPMTKACYEDFLTRQPDAGGRVMLWFKIVADEKLGGVVEEDETHDGGMVDEWSGDEKMDTCLRESLLTVTFPPPARGGVVTVGYPIALDPSSDEAEDGGK